MPNTNPQQSDVCHLPNKALRRVAQSDRVAELDVGRKYHVETTNGSSRPRSHQGVQPRPHQGFVSRSARPAAEFPPGRDPCVGIDEAHQRCQVTPRCRAYWIQPSSGRIGGPTGIRRAAIPKRLTPSTNTNNPGSVDPSRIRTSWAPAVSSSGRVRAQLGLSRKTAAVILKLDHRTPTQAARHIEMWRFPTIKRAMCHGRRRRDLNPSSLPRQLHRCLPGIRPHESEAGSDLRVQRRRSRATSMIDSSRRRPRKGVWTDDNQSVAANLFLGLQPPGKPVTRRETRKESTERQLQSRRFDSIDRQSRPATRLPLVQMVGSTTWRCTVRTPYTPFRR